MPRPIVSAFNSQARTFADAFKAQDLSSAAMRDAVKRWYRLYYEDAVTKEYDPSQRLAYTLVHKLSDTVFSEYTASYDGKGGKAAKLQSVLERLGEAKAKAMQEAMIAGEALIKPILAADGFDFLVIRRPNYSILARNEFGHVTSYGTIEVTTVNQDNQRLYYTLAEKRTVDSDGYVTVESRLYCSQNKELLGSPVPLGTLEKYQDLEEEVRWPVPLHCTGLIPIRMPMENCVDGTLDGVSVYAAAAGMIEKANRLEAMFNREFENARSRVIASSDLLKEDKHGNKRFEEDLFIGMDDDPREVGVTIFSPAIRDQSFMNRKNANLRDIENTISVKRGILSEVEATERTATEITSSEGGYNLTVIALQSVWTGVVQMVLRVCDGLGQIYLGWDSSEIEPPTIDYGDGVLFNRDKAWQEYERMVQYGWLKPEIALAWYFGVKIADETDLLEIRDKYMPGITDED